MTIREKMLKLPVWKAGLIVLLIAMFISIGIEELFISKVFHILDKSITHFDKVFKEESNEVDRDYRDFKEQQAYDSAESKVNELIFGNPDFSHQGIACNAVKANKILSSMTEFPAAKKHDYLRNRIDERINENKKIIDQYTQDKSFNPSKCTVA